MNHHHHHHHHHHAEVRYNKAFALGVGLNITYVVVEVTFGLAVGSLALLADAGHNLTDILGLLLAWGAAYLTLLKPSKRRTYGWRSSSILAALLNGLILLMAVGGIAGEAIRRFSEPHAVAGSTMMWVAGLGVLINGFTALLFFRGRHDDLNIRGAYLHMAADAGVSLGVVLAGFAIQQTGRLWIDPLVSLLVAGVILASTWDLLRGALNLALQSVPEGIDPDAVTEYLAALPGVTEVHDLHIWAMSTTETALTVHLVKPHVENEDQLLCHLARQLHDRFGIEHVTIQIERANDSANPCRQASPESL